MNVGLSFFISGLSLLLVFVYGFCLLNIFAMISFAFYRDLFRNTKGRFCSAFYECFTTYVHYGFINGPYEVCNVGTIFFTFITGRCWIILFFLQVCFKP